MNFTYLPLATRICFHDKQFQYQTISINNEVLHNLVLLIFIPTTFNVSIHLVQLRKSCLSVDPHEKELQLSDTRN